uniref:General transcription factor IIF subunit 2 n=1 Tax=Lygus hesperus TaxID=30085 RepID=A0A146L8X2_LYGHE
MQQQRPDARGGKNTIIGKYWVVKLPQFIYESWLDQVHEHKYLGDIEVTSTGSVKRIRFLVREPEPGTPQQIPFIVRQGHSMPTYLFTEQTKNEMSNRYDPSHTPAPPSYKMEDSIQGYAEIKPEDTPEYQQFLLHRLQRQQLAMMEKVTTPTFRDDIDIFGTISIQQEAAATRKIERREVATRTDKRSRSDINEVHARLVDLFHIKPQWSFQELLEQTDQPKNHLQEILKIYCNHHEDTRMYTIKSSDDILL